MIPNDWVPVVSVIVSGLLGIVLIVLKRRMPQRPPPPQTPTNGWTSLSRSYERQIAMLEHRIDDLERENDELREAMKREQ